MLKVPLKSYCPRSRKCVCGEKQIIDWRHAQCQTQAYISDKGDISCAKGCAEYFIKNTCFKCDQSTVQQQDQKSATQFFLALAQALQSAELHLSDKEKVQFITKLNQQVVQRQSY